MNSCECVSCTERYVGCHSECDKYKKYRSDLDERTENTKKMKRSMYGEYEVFKREQSYKGQKKKGKR